METLQTQHLSPLDASLVAIFMNGCLNQWDTLPPLARSFYDAGGSVEQLRGCLRHIIVLGGYGPCLAAQLTLHKAKLLPYDTPAKIGGPPGDAFELVYASVTDPVRAKVHSADPVLGEWIRLHLYGDIYSSPGLDMRRKQLIMCARLGQANMGEQLFGHAFAALRFGARAAELEEAVELGCRIGSEGGGSAAQNASVRKEALNVLHMAQAKFEREERKRHVGGGGPAPPSPPSPPEPSIPDPLSVFIPELYVAEVADDDDGFENEQDKQTEQTEEEEQVKLAWEAVDDRIDPSTGQWKK